MKKLRFLSLLLVFALMLPCSALAAEDAGAPGPADGSPVAMDVENMFSGRDRRGAYSDAIAVELSDSGVKTASADVRFSGGTVTITAEGTYLLTGSLSDGSIVVDVDKTEKVQLVLAGVSVTSASSAAVYVRQADKVFITLAGSTENILENGGRFVPVDENDIGAAVYARDDLTLNGTGSLTILSPAGVGIDAKDDLAVTGGTYSITAADHGIEANDSVRVAGGSLTIDAVGDGIHAENNDDPALGYVYIEDGRITVTSGGDGISAGADMLITGGTFDIVTAGGHENAAPHIESFGRGSAEQTPAANDVPSAKGLKAGSSILLEDGSFTINAMDDAVHANGCVHVLGGDFALLTGDDAMHADDILSIRGGVIDAPVCHEGMEGRVIEVLDGSVSVTADDDGFNAAGGADGSGSMSPWGGTDTFSAGTGAYLSIAGGTVYVNSEGDGLDANGSMFISGGNIIVSGPTGTGNCTLDYDGQGLITGGTFIGIGPNSMAQNFGAASTQGVIMTAVDPQPAGTEISLTDEDGKTLLSWTADKDFSLVIFSCPALEVGGSYTVTAGSYEAAITLDSLVYGVGGGFGGGRGGKGRFMG